ncbi:MAG TPA: hypothetical protein VGX70_14485, partial [Gemmataceae bacterium]|nr:hypothetical protein [Gemmataceae bacterium]
MRTRFLWIGLLLGVVMGLAPTAARCQDYEPPDPVYPLPLFHMHPENGGFYAAGEFVLFRQTNPLKSQPIAVRGFNDTFGQIQETMNFLTDLFFNNPGPPVQVGKFFGSGTPALDVNQVSGPNSYQPGFRTTLGWKFQNDLDIEFNWTHLVTKKNSATAAPVGPTLNGGVNNFDSFLFSPVYNYSNNYVGPQNKLIISLLTPGSFFLGPQVQQFLQDHNNQTIQGAVGIWNAAQLMTIQFTQRYDDFEIIGRIPVYESERCRVYGLFGPRHVQLWERFWWRTVDYSVQEAHIDITPTVILQRFGSAADAGVSGPIDQADYTNVVSNRLYGPLFGCGTDVYIGHGFGANFELRGAPMIDVVKERAKYELGDHSTSAQRNRTDYVMAYEVDARANLTWYPIEGVELRVGYELMNFFNTVSSPRPIDFNMGALTPTWERGTYRLFD